MSQEIATRGNNSQILSGQIWQDMKNQASILVKTGFLPVSVKTAEQAVAIMMKGQEIGIPPMQAFGGIDVIQGKPCVSPELMMALIYKNLPCAIINFTQLDKMACKIDAQRDSKQPIQRFSFTIEDAKNAGLLNKDNWRKYPRAMLRSRCIAEMGRSLFPDAISGCSYTPEELGANVNENNEVITIQNDKQVDNCITDMGAIDNRLSELRTPEPTKEQAPIDVTPEPILIQNYENMSNKEIIEFAIRRVIKLSDENCKELFRQSKTDTMMKVASDVSTAMTACKMLDEHNIEG